MNIGGILITRRLLDKEEKPNWMYREKADREIDSGWRIFAGNETENYLSNANNIVPVSYNTAIELDKELEINLLAPIGTAFERNLETNKWEIVDNWNHN